MYYVILTIKPSRKVWGHFVYDTSDGSVEFLSAKDFKRLRRKGIEFYDGYENSDFLSNTKCTKMHLLYNSTDYRNSIFGKVVFKDANVVAHTCFISFQYYRWNTDEMFLYFILKYDLNVSPSSGFTFAENTGGVIDRGRQILMPSLSVPKTFMSGILMDGNINLLSPFFCYDHQCIMLDRYYRYDEIADMVN